MDLQKKLINLSEYKCSFKYVDSYFLVSMIYPDTWSVIPSEDRTIEVAEEDGVTFYAAPIETDIEKAFSLIDDTIKYNLDVEKKISLLTYNIGKLQELFTERDLEELETLDFVFKAKKKTSNKSVTETKTDGKATKAKNKLPQKPKTGKKSVGEDKSPDEDVLENNKTHEEDDSPFKPIGYDTKEETNIIKNKYVEEVER